MILREKYNLGQLEVGCFLTFETISYVSKDLLVYLKDSYWETERWEEKPLNHWFTPQIFSMAKPWWAEPGSLPSSLLRVQGPKHVAILLSQAYEQESGLKME